MSVKLNYIYAHLDKFPANCGLSGEEIGEQFHQVNQKTREKLPNQHLVKDFWLITTGLWNLKPILNLKRVRIKN